LDVAFLAVLVDIEALALDFGQGPEANERFHDVGKDDRAGHGQGE
jgi:hypothetical protein